MADAIEMIKEFGQPLIVRRHSGGTHVGGQFVDGGWSEFTITASVQPMNGNELKNNEGLLRRVEGLVKIYSIEPLQVTDDAAKVKADQVKYNGEYYEVQRVEQWTQLNLKHYLSFAARLSQGAVKR